MSEKLQRFDCVYVCVCVFSKCKLESSENIYHLKKRFDRDRENAAKNRKIHSLLSIYIRLLRFCLCAMCVNGQGNTRDGNNRVCESQLPTNGFCPGFLFSDLNILKILPNSVVIWISNQPNFRYSARVKIFLFYLVFVKTMEEREIRI